MENNKQNTKLPVPNSHPDAEKKKKRYSITLMTSTALIIVAIIILNFIISVMSDRVNLNVDLTKDNILSFSDKTKEVISNVNMDVKIISLIPQSDDSREVIQIDEILKKYDLMSDKITYTKVDAKRNPAMLTKYKLDGKALDSYYYVIFETERMYTVVDVLDQSFMMKYYHNNKNLILTAALNAEQHFTVAINKVTKGSELEAYVLAGHGEKFTAEDFNMSIMHGQGIQFKELSLMSQDIPEGTDLIVVASPETDYSESEIAKLDAYMRSGGDVKIILDDTSNTIDKPLTNLLGYMGEWGVSLEEGIVADGDSAHQAGSPISVIADIPQNDVTAPMGLGGSKVVFTMARPISVDVIGKQDINAQILATTSNEGYIKNNIYSGFDRFESGDIKAKSNLAVLVSRSYDLGQVSHMAVIGSGMLFGEYNTKDFSILNRTGNKSFITGLVNYMTGQDIIVIAPKDIYQEEIVIDQMSIYIYTIITVVFVPLLVLSLGLIIWLKRRHS